MGRPPGRLCVHRGRDSLYTPDMCVAELARNLDDIELTDALTAAIRSTRLQEGADKRTKALVVRLVSWDTPPLSTSACKSNRTQ